MVLLCDFIMFLVMLVQVETIGDAYMVLCGAPVCTIHHAEYTANFAMDIIQATSKINDPSTSKSLKIRVGKYSFPLSLSLCPHDPV